MSDEPIEVALVPLETNAPEGKARAIKINERGLAFESAAEVFKMADASCAVVYARRT